MFLQTWEIQLEGFKIYIKAKYAPEELINGTNEIIERIVLFLSRFQKG